MELGAKVPLVQLEGKTALSKSLTGVWVAEAPREV